MLYYEITDTKITNTPYVDFDNPNSIFFAQEMGWIQGPEGFGIGDTFDGENWIKIEPETPELTPPDYNQESINEFVLGMMQEWAEMEGNDE